MTSGLDAARQREVTRLDPEILEAIGRGWRDPLTEAEFDRLARDVFAHQHRFNPVYRQFCLLQGVGAPADVTEWAMIPPVPTGAFKVGRWTTFPEAEERAAFRTSGTTQATRGVHAFDSLALYNAAALQSGRRFLLPDRERIRCLFLSPAPGDAPDSSLVHMFAVFREAFGAPGSAFFLTDGPGSGGFDPGILAAALDRARSDGEPVLVAGTALAFHHVVSSLAPESWALAAGSRAMVTGGFKGVRGDADPGGLAAAIERTLGIGPALQVAEYGMTELSTQYYDPRGRRALGVDASPGSGLVVPPWARVRIVEPETGRELADGEVGAVVHYDLANRGSAVALQTSDLGARLGPAEFELRGREPGAEARGCSLAADLWLAGE
ncbi:MAG TPA: acyl-protein synthetase [Gemmatimonadota bacterium]|nr:acyl-protein synthetase [Gemmatimonadota bacterium]